MICPACRASNPESSGVCSRCGRDLSWAPAVAGRRRRIPAAGLLIALAGVFGTLWFFLMIRPAVQNRAAARETVSRVHEVAAIARLRSLGVAEKVYAMSAAAHYGRLECLVRPPTCSPRLSDMPLVNETYLTQDHLYGYRFVFYEGRTAATDEPSAVASPDLLSYAYVAVPLPPTAGAARGFCIDSTRTVCSAPSEALESITDGKCPASCATLPSEGSSEPGDVALATAPPPASSPTANESPEETDAAAPSDESQKPGW
jgi:hypothetical protein